MSSLINLSPAAEVALLGLVLALVPVAVVAHRGRQQGLRGWPAWRRVLTVATLFLTVDLVVFGAFTRLTDSGLGCPDWPGCYGETSPWGAHEAISAAHSAAPTGPVSHPKAWIEMVHRYLATAVGALITGLMVMAWRWRGGTKSLSPWWATATFVWVCAQGAFGALTVTLKLQPIIVTLHLLGALLGVGLLTAQVRAMDAQSASSHALQLAHGAWRQASLRRWGWALLALVVVQSALGAWVSTNYALLACTEVPLCQGQWWPAMDFEMGFRLLRPLGGDGHGAYITQAALTAIHVTHRLVAMAVLAALLGYAWALRQWTWFGSSNVAAAGAPQLTPWARESAGLALLAAWQVLSGLSNVVLGWPLAAAMAHTLGAALLVWWLTRLLVLPYQGQHAVAWRTLAP